VSGQAAEGARDIGVIRGVLIPLQGIKLLLPNMAVTEISDYRTPIAPPAGSPSWLLGHVMWRRTQLGILSFERLIGREIDMERPHQRIMVCHGLDEDAGQPFVGILAQGIPRLVRVSESVLEPMDISEHEGKPVLAYVRLGEENAYVPDLAQLSALIGMTGLSDQIPGATSRHEP